MNDIQRPLILLDLGNVLLEFHPEWFAERLSRIAQNRSAAEILQRYVHGELKTAFERGQISEAEFFEEMVQWLGCRTEAVPFAMDAWNDVFTVKQGAEDAVRRLSERYRLWMLTDTNITHHQSILRRYVFLSPIERTFASYLCGVNKSQPEAFLQIIREAGCLPQEIIFYDDLETNIAVAKSVGIDARLFKSWPRVPELRIP